MELDEKAMTTKERILEVVNQPTWGEFFTRLVQAIIETVTQKEK